MNCRAKFDAASFILGEIRNRTNTQNYKKKNKQTVTDISTLCVSACVDNKCVNANLTDLTKYGSPKLTYQGQLL